MARKSRKDLIRAENSGQTAAAVQSKPCPEPAPTYLAVGYVWSQLCVRLEEESFLQTI